MTIEEITQKISDIKPLDGEAVCIHVSMRGSQWRMHGVKIRVEKWESEIGTSLLVCRGAAVHTCTVGTPPGTRVVHVKDIDGNQSYSFFAMTRGAAFHEIEGAFAIDAEEEISTAWAYSEGV